MTVPGRVGDWNTIRTIASGGFASVMEVEHHQTRRRAALKLLHLQHVGLEELTLRFLREAAILTTIRHPNIVEAIELGVSSDQRPFVVMELLAGRDLEQHVHERGAFPVGEVLELLEPICDAVSAAHAAGIVHRDVKLSNVFLAEDHGATRVVLLDFGVAKLQHAIDTSLSTSRHRIGSPMSMAPEQIVGGVVDARTDVYALGAMAFELLTGRAPFSGTDPTAVQFQQVHAVRPRPSAIVQIDPSIDLVITRAMSILPQDRYGSPREFYNALRAVCMPIVAAVGASPAIAAHVSVRLLRSADLEAGAREAHHQLQSIKAALAAFGFATAFEGSNELLLAKVLPDTAPDDLRARRAFVVIVEELAASMCSTSLLTSTCIAVHRAGASQEHGVWSGELIEMDWVPDLDVTAALYTPSMLMGLSGSFAVVANSSLMRVTSEPKIASERLVQLEGMAVLGRRLSMFIHELRAPLSCARLNLDQTLAKLRRGLPFASDDQLGLEEALDGIDRSAELITSLQELSRFGATVRVRERLRVRDLVATAVKMATPQIHDPIHVNVLQDADPWIEGSPGRLSQVLLNLLINAADAITGPGHIDVKTCVEDQRARIMIRDTGAGIAPEIRSHIFDAFFTTKSDGTGTGLGLHVVQEIVREHDGTITVESSLDAGTCFTIDLPLAPIVDVSHRRSSRIPVKFARVACPS